MNKMAARDIREYAATRQEAAFDYDLVASFDADCADRRQDFRERFIASDTDSVLLTGTSDRGHVAGSVRRLAGVHPWISGRPNADGFAGSGNEIRPAKNDGERAMGFRSGARGMTWCAAGIGDPRKRDCKAERR